MLKHLNRLLYSLLFIHKTELNFKHMHRITKRLLFVLLSIMVYLPMTIVNAMPNVSIPVQSQSATVMNMTTTQAMAMMDMDMAAVDCHHQANKICDHCSTQHSSHCVHSSCSVSLAITTLYSLLSINRDLKNSDKTLRINTQFQQPTRLLRPPISI
ncbi:MAG: hypothetical protein ACI9FO_000943 [Methylophagaceae bacterium]|jgi:hypothetical protein